MGGSKKGTARRLINTMIVFILCGLWHGASWTYVLWGLYSGLIVCIEAVLKKPVSNFFKNINVNVDSFIMTWLRRIGLFLLFIPGALIFRVQNVNDIGLIFTKMFTFTSLSSGLASLGVGIIEFVLIVLLIIGADCVFYFGELGRETTLKVSLSLERVAVYVVLICLIGVFWYSAVSSGDSSAFAYFQF